MNIFERQKRDFPDNNAVVGIDEAGRGPLAGPLVVAAVMLKNDVFHDKLNDSKKLSQAVREKLYDWILENSIEYTISIISVEDIDSLNILQATLLGMKKCVESFSLKPDIALFDGNKVPNITNVKSIPIIKGDSIYACIAAASIIAKVTRDRIMIQIDKEFPEYYFCEHKGYPTKKHIDNINKYGVLPIHRKTFKPISLMFC